MLKLKIHRIKYTSPKNDYKIEMFRLNTVKNRFFPDIPQDLPNYR